MTKTELMKKVKLLDIKDKSTRNNIVCSLIGHSKIVVSCFGYITCGRCGASIGNTLIGIYDVGEDVIIGHNCKQCRTNYKKLTWKDKLYVRNPFK